MYRQESIFRQGTILFFITLAADMVCLGLNLGIGYLLPTTLGFWLLLFSSLLVYGGLIWFYIYTRGEKDAEPHLYKKDILQDPYRGLKVGLVAMFPYLCALLFLILPMYGFDASLTDWFKLLSVPFLPILSFILPVDGADGLSWLTILWSGALYLIIPAVSGIAYIVGYNHTVDEIQKAMNSKKEDKN